jgi:hypothetical protein
VLYSCRADRGGHPRSLILIHGKRRLRARVWLDRPVIHADGFVNPQDQFDDGQPARVNEVGEWQRILLEELQRLVS